MAQSAVSTMLRAVFSMTDSVSIVALPSNTLVISFVSCPNPMRQGTHLPQVWAWDITRKLSAMSTGHSPGGLEAMRRSMSRYRLSTTVWACDGVLMSSLLKLYSLLFCPASSHRRKAITP